MCGRQAARPDGMPPAPGHSGLRDREAFAKHLLWIRSDENCKRFCTDRPKNPRYLIISFLTSSADTVAQHWDCERGVLGTTRYLEKSRKRFLVFSIAQIAQIKPFHGDLPSRSHRKTSPVCHQCRERRPCVCGGQGGTIPRIRAYLPGHAMFGPRA